ncbi:MAG: 2-dehydropantoate 2-reductase N-terminal domain-containing protein [Pseudomonadota bacterium]
MRWIVYGAGAIGATIGARLQLAGADVELIARGEHGARMARDGLTFVDPGGRTQLAVRVSEHPRDLRPQPEDVVLLCMKTQHTASALDDLRAAGFGATPVVCVQNGVANEPLVLRRMPQVYASVVNLPAQHLEPGVVVTFAAAPGAGVLDTGCYPEGVDDRARAIASGFTAAGFVAEADPDVMARKRAKLLLNLGNALELLLADGDDRRTAARVLRREGEAAFAAAGWRVMPLREFVDRSGDQVRRGEVPDVPHVGGSTWQSLQRGSASSEIDFFNGEVALQGRLHGVPTPVNATVLRLSLEVVAGQRAPRAMGWDELSRLSQAPQ